MTPDADRTPNQPSAVPLPESHLALIVEDLLAAAEAGPGDSDQPDPRAVLLYGWAIGATATSEIVGRRTVDPGLVHLSRGLPPTAEVLRSLRQHRARLEMLYGSVFDLCRAAGLQRLGEIDLDPPASPSSGPTTGRALARELLARWAVADERETPFAESLPPSFSQRAERRELLRMLRSGPGPGPRPEEPIAPKAAAPALRPPPSHAPPPPALPTGISRGLRAVGAAVAVVAILVCGLLTVRWVGATLATSQTRTAARLPDTSFGEIPGAQDEPGEMAISPDAIRDEAFRLAAKALSGNDLETARDLYVLAEAAVPGDEEAVLRRSQVETALSIDSRRGEWDSAITDLADLREVAPDSQAVLAAYVDSLMGASRQALTTGARDRSLAFCRDALALMPARQDARACLATPTIRTVVPATVTAPTVTATPRRSPAPITPAPLLVTPAPGL